MTEARIKIPPPLRRIPKRLKRGLKHPTVMAMTVKFGVKVGHEAYLLRTEEIDYAEFKRRTIAHIGEISGTTLGAAIGGLAGSWVPGVGALFGAFLGSMAGEMAGEYVGRKSAHRVHRALRRDEQKRKDAAQSEKQEPEPPDLKLPGRKL
jgi:hypothetical protein